MSENGAETRGLNVTQILLVLAVTALAYYAYRYLGLSGATGLDPSVLKIVLWTGLPLAAVAFLHGHRGGWPGGAGLKGPILPALLPGLAGGAVMFAIFLAYGLAPAWPSGEDFYIQTISAPVGEEVLFRGYLITQLVLAGLNMRVALILSALVFGFLHLPNVWASGDVMHMAMEVGITAAGGLVFGLLMLLMGGSVVAPIMLHAAMNLAWLLFEVAADAVGGSEGFIARIAAVAVALFLGVWLQRARNAEADGA